jgi:glycerol-3-phosphate dehydrogenase
MPSQRPTWLIRLGLFLYDHLGGHSSLPHSTYLTRKNAPQKFKDLSPIYDKGFCYFDAKTHDARLTLENALLAHQKGATILNYTKCERCYVDGKFWHLDLTSKAHGALNIRANFVINAAGPYIDDLSSQLNLPISKPIKKVKGSHIVVDQKLPGNFGYLLQHEDNRVIFVLPYHEHTLIGTTDVMFNGGLDQINIDDAEIAYLLACYNLYFEDKITTHDIINSWSGVRPLIDDAHLNPSDVSRDFYLDFMPKSLPLLNVLGGKLTTYRELSEEAIDKIRPLFPNLLPSMTHQLKLPGAQGDESFEIFSKTIDARYPKIKKTQLNRYIDTYGMRFTQFLNPSDSIDDLGENFGYDFTQRELDFLVDKEWARTLEDVLWRRTKLGLLADKTFEEKIAKYLLLKIKPLP